MAEAHETEKIIYQNLIDAGCNEMIRNECMCLLRAGEKSDMFNLLLKQRKVLLETMRKKQKQIDCLDYLIYQIQRKQEVLT